MKTSSHIGHITELLDLIQQTPSPADRVVARFFLQRRYLGSRDRRIISEITYSIFRHAFRCERLTGEILSRLNIDAPRTYPKLWLVAVHAVCILNTPPEDIVDEIGSQWNVIEPRIDPLDFARTAASLKNLDFIGDDPVERLCVQTSFPRWMVEEWIGQIGLEPAGKLCEALNCHAPLTIRVNTLLGDIAGCERRLKEEGIESFRTKYSPFGLSIAKRVNFQALQSYREGLYEIQDEGSQLVSLAANPQPSSSVVDACAGGGGKTLHLAALMENTGIITALDTGEGRLGQLVRRSERAGVRNIRTRVVGEDWSVSGDLEGSADVVLIDAPCSGTGTIRRNPLLKWRVTPADVKKYACRQKELLHRYSRCAKAGGTVVYATCSLFRAENDEVVEDFLLKISDFTVEKAGSVLGRWGLGNLADGNFIKLMPSSHGTDGFFIAVLKRNG